VNGNRGGRFERGGADHVYLAGPSIGRAEELILFNDGSEDYADWSVGDVVLAGASEATFKFDRVVRAGTSERAAPA
jgi:hypothetical protein